MRAPSPGRRRVGLLCLAIGVGWHVFWVLALTPAPAPSRRPPSPRPRLLFAVATADAADPQTDPRALWSPVLFSLPTPMGFSRSLLDSRVGARPPSGPVASASYLLDRAPPGGGEPFLDPAEPLGEAVARTLFQVTPPPLEEPAFPSAPVARPGLQVELSGELAGRAWAVPPVLEPPAALRARAWEVGAFVQSDDGRRLRHVFLESPSTLPEANQLVESALRRARLEPGPPVQGGRVVVRSAGAPAEASAARNPP